MHTYSEHIKTVSTHTHTYTHPSIHIHIQTKIPFGLFPGEDSRTLCSGASGSLPRHLYKMWRCKVRVGRCNGALCLVGVCSVIVAALKKVTSRVKICCYCTWFLKGLKRTDDTLWGDDTKVPATFLGARGQRRDELWGKQRVIFLDIAISLGGLFLVVLRHWQ